MTKYVVVVGGVISGVGKGVASASIGRILQEYGFSVTAIKIDPYINCDAGTLRPTEHGEVWVTHDGGEIDQDLGNYERFLGHSISKKNNITTGQVYKSVIDKERRGDFLGETVMFIPHITDEIKKRIVDSSKGYDICVIEIGGTIGDYENIPFLFAIKSLENDIGKGNVSYVLVTYMPIPSHIDEMKTKPTQIAVKLLRENGIQPDFILCRGKKALDDVRKKKIASYANVLSNNIISMPDVKGPGTRNTIYVVPSDLERENLGHKLMLNLSLVNKRDPDWSQWSMAVNKIINPSKEVNIAIVGKYLDLGDYKILDSYLSIDEALKHAGSKNDVKIKISWIDAKDLEKDYDFVKKTLSDYRGIIIPGGFGNSGVEGKINSIRFCRENNIPFLGLCYGLQLAVVEFARNVCGLLDAHTTEVNPTTPYPVIDILHEQKSVIDKGGTMRLGSYKAVLKNNSFVKNIYGNKSEVFERHRHRFEVNPDYHEVLEKGGLILSGTSPDGKLVEFIELPNHKFFVATQAHPEFQSYLTKPAPLFDEFVRVCMG